MSSMCHSEVKTKYESIVPKGSVGVVSGFDTGKLGVPLLKVNFKNGESFWFLKRDLEVHNG